MSIGFDDIAMDEVQIKVVGVGGAGGNAVNLMIETGVEGVEFLVLNTDRAALNHSQATQTIQLGEKLTRGLGAGGNPERGQRAAEESRDEIAAALKGVNMIFITAGMGGGTGTGAAPVVAEIARDMGILTVGIVTKPFKFEGRRRMEQAENGVAALREKVDSLVIIPNERIKAAATGIEKFTLAQGFHMADDVLRHGVQSITQLIKGHGLVNLDFEDVRTVMKDAGYAHMGVGTASGPNCGEEAARLAVNSPLLETSIDGARGVLINICGSADMELDEVEKAAECIHSAVHPDAVIIWGTAYDDKLGNAMQVTVIATGLVTDGAYTSTTASTATASNNAAAGGNTPDDDDPFTGILDIFSNRGDK